MAIFGDNVIAGTYGTNIYNYISGSRFTLSEDGDVTKLTAYMHNNTGASCNIKGLIYTEGTNQPTTLVASTPATAIGAAQGPGWVDMTFSSPVHLVAGSYWLMYVGDSTSTNINNDRDLTTGYGGYSNQTAGNYDSPPNSPTMNTVGSRSYSVYATYTAGSDRSILLQFGIA